MPEHGPQTGEQTREAMCPVAASVKKAQQDVGEQCRPHLPFNGVATVPEKSSEFQRLFDLLEECLDIPARFVQIADAGGNPLNSGGVTATAAAGSGGVTAAGSGLNIQYS